MIELEIMIIGVIAIVSAVILFGYDR